MVILPAVVDVHILVACGLPLWLREDVGMLANEVIAVVFLREPLRRRDLIGIFFLAVGIAMVIVAVPASDKKLDVHTLLSTAVILAQHTYWYLIAVLLFVFHHLVLKTPTK